MNTRQSTLGGLYMTLAFLSWGSLPIYWKYLDHVPASEILGHRIVWSLVFCIFILGCLRQLKDLITRVSNFKSFLFLIISGSIIGGNWFIYIWAVNNGHIVQCSLGYYINPLLSVVLGMIVLNERLSPLKLAAVLLAALGVSFLIWDFGSLPWIALGLSFSFAVYGLIRKVVPVSSLDGLTIETAVLLVPALMFIFQLEGKGQGHFFELDFLDSLLLMGTGPATALPLIWFAAGAKRLPLTTIGFFQYIAPSLQLILGVFVYEEPFTSTHFITFIFIWMALLLYSLDTVKQIKKSMLTKRS